MRRWAWSTTLAAVAAHPGPVTRPPTPKPPHSFTPAAGSLLVALCATGNYTGVTVTGVAVTDSVGGTWTQLVRAGAGAVLSDASVWVKDAGPSPVAQTVTFTISPSTVHACGLVVTQFSGTAPAASQTAGGHAAATGTVSSVAVTPAVTGSWTVGAFGGSNGTTVVANGSSILFGQTSSTSNVTQAAFEALFASTAGSPITLGITATQTAAAIAVAEILPAAGTDATVTLAGRGGGLCGGSCCRPDRCHHPRRHSPPRSRSQPAR